MARPKKTETSAETKKPTTRKTRTKKEETKPVEEQVNEVLDETPSTEEQPTEQPKPIGTLFNVINYNNTSDLDRFIDGLTPDQALYCVVQAARAAHQRSAYGMEESEVVSKAIRVLTTPKESQQEVPEPEVRKA